MKNQTNSYRVTKITNCDKTIHYEIERKWTLFWIFSGWSTVDQDINPFQTWGPYKFETKEKADQAIELLKAPIIKEVLE